MQLDHSSGYLLGEARQHDPDRYLCALLAPADRRDALLALVLFNHELARIVDLVSQPTAGMIRFQWWREALDELTSGQPPRRHPVVEALAPVLAEGLVDPLGLQSLIDAREPALERIAPDAGALETFAAATSGALQAIQYAALGGRDPAQAAGAEAIGTAFGLVGLMGALRQEAELKTDPRSGEAIDPLLDSMRVRATERLREGRALAGRPARRHIVAFLPATLAESYLRRLERAPGTALDRPATAPLRLMASAFRRRP